MLPKDQTFWEFCLQVWQLDQAQEILLKASIESEFDVVGFLYLLWLHLQDASCDSTAFLNIQASYLAVIDPLRRARRNAKHLTEDKLYQQLKASELSVEKEYAQALANIPRESAPSEAIKNLYLNSKPMNFETSMLF